MQKIFEKKIVYTAILGNIDALPEPDFQASPDTEYVCFTDSDKIVSRFWTIIPVETCDFTRSHTVIDRLAQSGARKPSLGMLKNRELKFFPEVFLKGAKASAYMDGHVRLKSCISPLIDTALAEDEWCSPPHRYDGNALIEALRCFDADKIGRDELRTFFEDIAPISIPKDTPFPENGLILRRHGSPAVAKMSEQWWERFSNGPYRDQLHWQLAYLEAQPRFGLLPHKFNEENQYYSLGRHNGAKVNFLKAKYKFLTRKSFF